MPPTVADLPDVALFTAGAVALLGTVFAIEFAVHWIVKATREALL